MEQLHDRIRRHLDGHELLVPRDVVEEILADVVATDARMLGQRPPEWGVR